MRRVDKIKSLPIDKFAKYLATEWSHDNDPVIRWFDDKYCNDCESVMTEDGEYAWCEVYKKCKYFPDLDKVPSYEDTFRFWWEEDIKSL